jgi:hypothetical protein
VRSLCANAIQLSNTLAARMKADVLRVQRMHLD